MYNTVTFFLSAFFLVVLISLLSIEFNIVSQGYNIMGKAWARNINGTENADNITGTINKDIIKGLGGNDMLVGGPGNDKLTGGRGKDIFICGTGTDTVTDFNLTQKDTIPKNDCENIEE